MRTFTTIVLTTVYVLVAVRVDIVMNGVEERSGRNDYFDAAMVSAVWPFSAVIYSSVVLLTGDAGIYDSSYKYHGK